MLKSHVFILILSVLVVSCASTGHKERSDLRSFIQQKKYDEALSFVDKNDFFKEERSRLLYYLEKGIIHHYKGNYFQSSRSLNEAILLSEKLFTKSISSAAKTAIANDAYDLYYGEMYERSLMYYFSSLNHLMLFQKGKYESYTVQEGEATKVIPEKVLSDREKKEELFRARASVLAWDSFLSTIKKNRSGETVFKDDLLAKLFGAYVHEVVGTRSDMQIALSLYVDAYDILFKNYNRYESLNTLADLFRADYSKLPQMTPLDVEKKYIARTPFQNELIEYIQLKVLSLGKKYRAGELKKYVRTLNIPNEIEKRAKVDSGNANVGIVLQQGLIPAKVADKHYYGLEQALRDPNSSSGVKAAAAIGHLVLTVFAAEKLGLLPPPQSYDPVRAHVGLNVASIAAEKIAFAFELPKIDYRQLNQKLVIRALDINGKEVASKTAVVGAPLADLAKEGVQEHSTSIFVRTGLRVAGKHLAAIAASYGTYKALEKQGEFFAKTAAVLQYVGATKGIEASESADTRYWSTLPESIHLTDLSLPKGDYKLEVYRLAMGEGFDPAKSLKVQEITVQVENTSQKQIVLVGI